MKKSKALTDAAKKADRLRKKLELREGRPARQEAEYQAAQQARRERGGIGMLAMIPEAVRRAQMRVGDRLLASSEARENAPLRAEVDAADREVTDNLGRMKRGGKVTLTASSAVEKRKAGGKMKMVRKGDNMVPDFAADGVGKMREGGGVCRGMGAATKGGKFRMG
jgi:hypothetical protein